MGNEASLPLDMCATFDAEEIKRLGKRRVLTIYILPSHRNTRQNEQINRVDLFCRFKKLDLDNSGSLSVDEFMSLPELQQNPLVQRVIGGNCAFFMLLHFPFSEIFDDDGNGEVDFKEFIQGVSQFSVKGDKNSKLRFAFRIYDIDNDGYISNGELFQVGLLPLHLKTFQ